VDGEVEPVPPERVHAPQVRVTVHVDGGDPSAFLDVQRTGEPEQSRQPVDDATAAHREPAVDGQVRAGGTAPVEADEAGELDHLRGVDTRQTLGEELLGAAPVGGRPGDR
jgi:hypothetical protein